MEEFKIGDVVRRTEGSFDGFHRGEEGTIIKVLYGTIDVKLKNGDIAKGIASYKVELVENANQEVNKKMVEFKKGDLVERLDMGSNGGFNPGDIGEVICVDSQTDIDVRLKDGHLSSANNCDCLKLAFGNDIKLEKINKNNLVEAKKQFDKEKSNAEIEEAKVMLRAATDNLDRLNREIKVLKEEKKPFEDILKNFK